MNQKEEIEIDLVDMCKFILSKWIVMIVGAAICAGVAFGMVKMKSTMQYTSELKAYVTVPKTSDKVLIRDSASELAADYVKMANTDLVLKEIAKESGVKKSIVKDALTVEVEEGTRILNITVMTDKESSTKKIAKHTLYAMNQVIVNNLGKSKIVTLTDAGEVKATSSMSMKKYVGVGALGGFILVAGCYFVIYLVKISKKENQ